MAMKAKVNTGVVSVCRSTHAVLAMAWACTRFTLEAISRRIDESPGIIFSAIVRISADGHGMATTMGRPMHTAITRYPRP